VNLKVKKLEKGVGICSLAHNTLEVKKCIEISGWGLGRMIIGVIIHMDLHKPNNKLI
jgi:hypothetical protein